MITQHNCDNSQEWPIRKKSVIDFNDLMRYIHAYIIRSGIQMATDFDFKNSSTLILIFLKFLGESRKPVKKCLRTIETA